MIQYLDLLKTIFIGFLISAVLGPIIIPVLKSMGIGQSVREEGPQSHLKKTGTPTMGGIIIILALIATVFLVGKRDINSSILLILTLGFGLIGFIDDYIIVVRKDNAGLRAYQKLIGQFALAIGFSLYLYYSPNFNTELIVPFIGMNLDIGFFYIPFTVFVIVGTVNSVNLTDGLDGLATGVTMIVLVFFAIVAFIWNMASISIFSIALAGACLGFLIHNAYPAKVFMGDTGSLALGGAVAGLAVLLNLQLLIPIVGGIYFIEALSVIIQVGSYKLRGKRVFLMSPLHHHYEHKGWKETKVVIVFWSLTVIFCLVGVYSLI